MPKSKAQQEVDEFLSAYSNKDSKSVIPKLVDWDDDISNNFNQDTGLINFSSSDPFNVNGHQIKARLSRNIVIEDNVILFKGTVVDSLTLLFLDEEWDIEFLTSNNESIRENNTTYEAVIDGQSFLVKLADLIPFEPSKDF